MVDSYYLSVTSLDSVMYVDPITCQRFEYANRIPCENNPLKVFALDPDTDQNCFLSANLLKKTLLYLLNQLKSKLLIAQTPLMSTMQVSILKRNSNIFGIVFLYQTFG